MNIDVSVIIPVYNACDYIKQAVESAVVQNEVHEILLIEDGSSDDSLEVCKMLSQQYDKAKLFEHAGQKNRGAGPSRNLGISKAECEYISFLDADDFFLENRFHEARKLFNKRDIDGVYEAVGFYYENEEVRSERRTIGELTTMKEVVLPEQLFEKQSPIGDEGYCHIDGWIVKRDIFNKVGLFDENLLLHQDTAMFIKFAALGKMVPGKLNEPVALRRLHGNNRITKKISNYEHYKNKLLMWETLWLWSKENVNSKRRQIILNKLVHFAALDYNQNANKKYSFSQSLKLLIHYPSLIQERYFWRIFAKCIIQ
jgi:glycosyltransferase involved in cell wall biosynthesis